MERTSRWLIVSIIIVGIGILLFAGKLGYEYISKQSPKTTGAASSSEASGKDGLENTVAEGTDEKSVYTEDPYYKIKRASGFSDLEEGNTLVVGGYELELLNIEYTKTCGDWMLNDGMTADWIGQVDENHNILSDEQYIVLHIRVTAKEECSPYVSKEEVSQYPVGNFRMWFYDTDQNLDSGYEIYAAGGDAYADGDPATAPWVVDLNYGETKEFEVVFVDSDLRFCQKEPFYMVLAPNISGMVPSSDIKGDIWKGFIRYVEN